MNNNKNCMPALIGGFGKISLSFYSKLNFWLLLSFYRFSILSKNLIKPMSTLSFKEDKTNYISKTNPQFGPYLAGLIEGDGSIAVHDSTSKNKKFSPKIIVVFIFLIYLLTYYSFPDIHNYQDSLLAAAPVIVYSNVETDKSKILSDNKGKAAIYMWTHIESGKRYIGSAVDLYNRLKYYFSPLGLKRANNYISRAIISHKHSAFSLSIIEYIDISNLSKESARKLILEREQHHIDSLGPEYNINPIAGSRLGSGHTELAKAKMRKRKHTEETKALISLAMSGENNPMYGRRGENNPNFGKIFSHSTETKSLISKALLGKPLSEETKAKMSLAKSGENNPLSKKVYVYINSTPPILEYEFASIIETAKYFKCSHTSISRYIKNDKLFQGKWILSLCSK